MSLLLALLPLYLVGNVHCFGMCGPLVMLIGRHRFRLFYFLGRTLSYTLTGWLAGSLGFVLALFLNAYRIGATLSLAFGVFLFYLGGVTLWKWPRLQWPRFEKKLAHLNRHLSFLILKDRPLTTFLFGFFTVLLPCGQTLIVFSACAMAGVAWVGALNGFVFASLTSPSLAVAMHFSRYLSRFQRLSDLVVGLTACLVGLFSLFRGLADLGVIPHLILSEKYHMVLW